MNITIMLGNGFDVSFDIQSSYSSFYKWYCSQKSDVPHIDEFRKNINAEINSDIPDEEKMWSDFEVGLGKYTEKFSVDDVDKYLECYSDAIKNIRKYLVEQEDSFDISSFSKESILSFTESLCHFYDEITDIDKLPINEYLGNNSQQDRNISFITFNYTKTLEKIINKIPDKPLSSWQKNEKKYSYILNRNVIHIHGTTDDSLILGVNDETQIENKELLKTSQFKEMMVKAESVELMGHLWQREAEKQISQSMFVCILGMSLGPTDAKWWRKLVQWLKANGSRRILLYWFEKDPPEPYNTIEQIRCIDKAKEKLLSFSNLSPAEKAALKKQISVIINTSKFLKLPKIVSANEEPLETAG
ncbi:MAG: AbiH family protein [Acutalibacteraceae bacterium]